MDVGTSFADCRHGGSPVAPVSLAMGLVTTMVRSSTGPSRSTNIWYGNWAGLNPGAKPILTDWAQSIGNSPYFNINTTYGDTTANVSGAVAYGSSIDVPDSTFGTSLSDSSISSIVSYSVSHGLPTDTNGLYVVLTAQGIAETSGFLTQYRGWHTYGTFISSSLKYSFVGDAGTSSGCSVQFGNIPNGDPSADAMVSVMAHELEETATDPSLNAWTAGTGSWTLTIAASDSAKKGNNSFTVTASGGGVTKLVSGSVRIQ